MSLNIYRFFMQFSNLKAFHRFANEYLKERYPNFPNYENFLKATNKSFPMMMMFVNSVLAKNREKCAGETIHFIDSTPVEVCKNNKISRHKVAKDCTSRGKSTKGQFFGFKLHGVCKNNQQPRRRASGYVVLIRQLQSALIPFVATQSVGGLNPPHE